MKRLIHSELPSQRAARHSKMVDKEYITKRRLPSCKDCCYGKHHEVCFPCYKDMLGQEGVKAWKEKQKHSQKE